MPYLHLYNLVGKPIWSGPVDPTNDLATATRNILRRSKMHLDAFGPVNEHTPAKIREAATHMGRFILGPLGGVVLIAADSKAPKLTDSATGQLLEATFHIAHEEA